MDDFTSGQLGPYRILEQIGAGGMATVYKAYHAAMDRYVAVKVLPGQMSTDPKLRKRFDQEAKLIAKLEHAHVLPVHEYGQARGRLYLVMRYIQAGTLKDRIIDAPIDLIEANRIMQQVGGALEYAHRQGVVHRDVKPSNVLLDAQGDCYLTDFGLARIMEASVRLTATGVGVGTPDYMSPEQGQGVKVDARSDLYSLGVMLYEMLTGRVPYEAETPMAVVLKHISAPLPLPRSVDPSIPEGVERVILKAMAKDPADRFQTAEEMVAALDAAVRMAGAEAAMTGAADRPAAAGEARPRFEGVLAQVAVGLRQAAGTGWGRAVLWASVGILALLAFYLVLSRVPLRVQIRGGQLEVLKIVDAAATPADVVARATEVAPTSTPWPTAAPTATPAPQPTVTPVPPRAAEPTTMPTPVPTRAPVSPQVPPTEPFPPIAINAMAVDPNDPNVVFAGTYGAGIYISRDGGHTWTPSNEGLGKGTVGSIVVDANDFSVVYAALLEQGGVYKSTDGGQTWVPANQGIDLDAAWDHTGLVYLDPADSSRLYYSGTTNGLYCSEDGGTTWQQRSHAGPAVTGLAIDPGDSEHLYVGAYRDLGAPDQTGAGIYESHDGGRTWQLLTREEMAAPGGDFWHLSVGSQDLSVLYASGRRGTYKTPDGGRSWMPILDQSCDWLAASEVALYCGAGDDLFLSPDDGQSWREISDGADWRGPESLHFAIAPSDPQTLYGGTNAIMKSTDGGWTWTYVGRPGADARMRLTVDPRDGSRLFLNGLDYVNKVLRSEDGGRTWQAVATYGGWRGRIAIDAAQDVLYLPTDSGELYRSRDNGQTWERFGSGYITGGPRQLMPDPRDAKRLWLVGECGSRLSLSQDGGETFAVVASFPQEICSPTLLMHKDGRRMYVVAWDGVFRSDDGGETWHSLEGPGGIYPAAALDPSNADVVYVGSTHKGVFKTEDGGLTWRPASVGLTSPAINELAIDPANPQIIYAATDGGAFVTANGGERWSPIQEQLGLNPIVYSIAVDPSDPSKVYAVTPDGTSQLAGVPMGKIVCVDGRTGNGEIYVANSDGSGERRLTDHPADDRYPAWAPDGVRIVFSSDRDPVGRDSRQLYIVNADGSNLVRLTYTERTDKHPSWSPDGGRIAFHSWGSLVAVDADGSNRVTLVEGREGLGASFPTWSPDGQRIAFRSTLGPDQGGPYQHDIYVVNADGSELLRLATLQSGETGDLSSEQVGGHVVWSPDGRQVAFDVWLEGQRRYYAVSSDGSGQPAEIPSIPDSWYPWFWPQWAAAPRLTPLGAPVTVSLSGDVYSHLYGPAGDLASRDPHTGFDVTVQSRDAEQVVVELPSGESVVLPPYGDIYGWERRYSDSVQGAPQAGVYTFTVLDADGTPIPGAVDTDVYLGGYEPDPPANVHAEVIERGILVTWEPSPVIPGAFDPLGKPPVGWYTVSLHREGRELVYGWAHEHRSLPQPSFLIPYRRQDFGIGDTGRALEELEDGVYTLELHAFSVAPEGTDGYYVECIAYDPAEVVRIVIEGGQVRVEKASAASAAPPLPSLSGRVTDAATGQGIAGAKVEVRPERGWAPEDRWPYLITTDPDGRYALFDLEAGDYVLRVTASGYAREYYDNVLPSHEARPVHVTARRETSGIDFRLNQGGSISGHVYRSDRVTPIGGAAVYVRPSKYPFDHGFWAFTDANGAYTVQSLPLGRFRVTVQAAGYVRLVQFYGQVYGWKNAPDVVVTPPSNVSGIDILLDRAGSISGRVYASDGVTPIPHVAVWADTVDGEFSEGFEGSSDQDGRYLITGIPPGTFTARTENMRYANEYYDAKPTGRTADLIVVREGETTPDVNFTLDEGGSITGRVYDQETGDLVQDIHVAACLPDGDCSVPTIGTSTYDGSFKLLLRPGLYFVCTGSGASSMLGFKYVPEWYDDAYDMSAATLLDVTLGQETSGINLYLARSGSITGRVYSENGDPIGDASVYAFSDVYPGNGSNAQPDGSYRIEGLLSGAYVVQVTVSGYVSEYYSDVTDPASATRVTVNAPDDTPGIDFALSRVSE